MTKKESSVVLILNDQQELALQLRAAHDTSYPSHWDFSAAGGIEKSEIPDDAAVRELSEELGIEGNPEYVEQVRFEDAKGVDQLYIYLLRHNGPFLPNPSEVAAVKFASLAEVANMFEQGELFHPEFTFLWQNGFFAKLLGGSVTHRG